MKPAGILTLLLIASHSLKAFADSAVDPWEARVVPAFMVLAGLAIAATWTLDLVKQEKVASSEGFLRIRDRETGERVLPHLIAEYATAISLVSGAVGLAAGEAWGRAVSLIALGALMYTATNSLSWVVTEKGRWPYGIPMVISLIGALVSFAILL